MNREILQMRADRLGVPYTSQTQDGELEVMCQTMEANMVGEVAEFERRGNTPSCLGENWDGAGLPQCAKCEGEYHCRVKFFAKFVGMLSTYGLTVDSPVSEIAQLMAMSEDSVNVALAGVPPGKSPMTKSVAEIADALGVKPTKMEIRVETEPLDQVAPVAAAQVEVETPAVEERPLQSAPAAPVTQEVTMQSIEQMGMPGIEAPAPKVKKSNGVSKPKAEKKAKPKAEKKAKPVKAAKVPFVGPVAKPAAAKGKLTAKSGSKKSVQAQAKANLAKARMVAKINKAKQGNKVAAAAAGKQKGRPSQKKVAAAKRAPARAVKPTGNGEVRSPFERERARSPKVGALKLGTVLERQWKGQMLRVKVLKDGYLLGTTKYPTLYSIIKEVCGTKPYDQKSEDGKVLNNRVPKQTPAWSAPRFFGLG